MKLSIFQTGIWCTMYKVWPYPYSMERETFPPYHSLIGSSKRGSSKSMNYVSYLSLDGACLGSVVKHPVSDRSPRPCPHPCISPHQLQSVSGGEKGIDAERLGWGRLMEINATQMNLDKLLMNTFPITCFHLVLPSLTHSPSLMMRNISRGPNSIYCKDFIWPGRKRLKTKLVHLIKSTLFTDLPIFQIPTSMSFSLI